MPNGDPVSVIITPQAIAGVESGTAALKELVAELVLVSEEAKRMEGNLKGATGLKGVVNGQNEIAEALKRVEGLSKESIAAIRAENALRAIALKERIEGEKAATEQAKRALLEEQAARKRAHESRTNDEREWQKLLKEEADQNKRAAKEESDRLKAAERQRKEYEKWWADAIKERQKLETDAAKERDRIANLEAKRAEYDIQQAQREANRGRTAATPLERAQNRNDVATGDDAAEIARLNEATRQANLENRRWAQSVNYAEDSLAQMRLTLKDLQGQYDLLTRAERENAAVGGQLADQIRNVEREISANERVTGRSTRSWNELGNSIQQIGRELPNFALNFRTGVSAISNNLPQLQEAITNARNENARLRAEGQATVPVFKQIVSSIFSWQTALIALISIVVAFSDEIAEFFSELFKGTKILNDLQVAQGEYNKVLKESANASVDVGQKMQVLRARFFDAKASVNDKKEVVKDLNKEYSSTIGKINNINEAERFFVNKSADYVKAVTLRAQAQAAMSLIVKNNQALFEAEIGTAEESAGFWRKAGANASALMTFGGEYSYDKIYSDILERKRNIDNNKLRADVQRKNTSLTQMIINMERTADGLAGKQGFKFDETKEPKEKKPKKPTDTTNAELKAEEDVFKYRIERIKQMTRENIEQNKTIMEDEGRSYSEIIEAARQYSEERINLVRLDRAQEQGVIEVALQKIKDVEGKAVGKRSEQEKTLLLRKKALLEQYKTVKAKHDADEVKTERETSEARMKVHTDEFKRRQKITELEITDNDEKLSSGLNKELQDLAKQYAARNITREQYERRAALATKRVQSESLLFALDLQDEEIKQAKRKGVDTVDLERKSADLRIKIQQEASDAIVRAYEEEAAARQALVDSFKELGRQIADTLFQIADESLQRDKDNLEERKGVIEKNLENEIDRINVSMVAGVDKENAIIDAKAAAADKEKEIAAQQEQIEKRRQELQEIAQIGAITANALQTGFLLQAKAIELAAEAAGATALGNIPQGIALGAAAAFTQAQVGVVAALAAAQIAGILAFEKGTDYSPEGWALTDEKGAELYIPKSGKPFLGSNDGPTMRYLQEGTKVIPHHEVMAMVNSYAGMPVAFDGWGVGKSDTAAIVSALEGLEGTFAREIRNKKENSLTITAKGLQHMSRTGANTNTYLHRVKH